MKFNLLQAFSPKLADEQREQINGILLFTNFRRMYMVAVVSLIVVLLFELLPDMLFQYSGIIRFQVPIGQIFGYYLAMALFLSIYIGLYHIFKPADSSHVKPIHAVLVISFMFIFLYMAIFLALADQYITGAITLYLMGAIFLALVFYFPPAINCILFLSGLFFFMFTLPVYQTDMLLIYRHYVSAIELSVGASLASVIIYSFKCRQIGQILRIQEQHSEIADSNELLKKNAEELKKLDEEKDELMGIMAHDLKNPLNGIKGIAELIELDPHMDESQMKDLLGFVKNYSDRMNAIIINLLNINAIDSGKMKMEKKDVNIEEQVQEVVAAYATVAAKKNIRLNFYSAKKAPLALGDSQAVYQILDNLISNAIKFSPLNKDIWIEVKRRGTWIMIRVQDEGPGLTDEDKTKLFGRYAKLTARPTMNEHSTGLGLSIVHKLVSAMNGRVNCRSEVGKGATFIVSLPAASTIVEKRYNSRSNSTIIPA